MFMGDVILISTIDHKQPQPVSGIQLLLLSHLIIYYKMMKVETYVRTFGDMIFQRLQKIIQMHYSSFTDDILDELRKLLNEVPTYTNT